MYPVHTSLVGFGAAIGILVTGSVVQAYELAGGDETGKYHRLSAAIAETITRADVLDGGRSLAPLPSEGFVDNARLMREGKAEFGLVDSIAAHWILKAEGPFADDQPFDGLKVIATLWYDVDHFVINAEALQSGTIADFADLSGARVSLSDEATTGINSNREVLGRRGGAVDTRIDLDALSGPSPVQRLDYDQIAGLAASAPIPSAIVSEAIEALPGGGVLVGLTSGQFASLPGSRDGAWSAYSIPEGTYPGQDAEIDTTARPIMLVAREDVGEEDVFQIIRTLYRNLPTLIEESELARLIGLENAVSEDLPFPLHPGAARYFELVGLVADRDVFERLRASQDPLARRDSTIDPWKAHRPLQSIVFSGEPEGERSRAFISFFDFNSVDLDEPGEATVEEIATFAKSLGNAEIYVAGHTDRAGSRSINERIASERADSVVERLLELGYDDRLITAEGFGEDRPAISTADNEQHQHNRRVETIVTLPAVAAAPATEEPEAVASLENRSTGAADEGVADPSDTDQSDTDQSGTDQSDTGSGIDAEAGTEPAADEASVAKVEEPSGGSLPILLVEDVSGKEGDPDLTLDLRLSEPTNVPVVLIVTQLNGTATAGQDFENTPSVITLKPGETGTQLKTVLIDDDLVEADESFSLQISGSRDHVALPDDPITITIEDDD